MPSSGTPRRLTPHLPRPLVHEGPGVRRDGRGVPVTNSPSESLHEAADTNEVDATWRAEATRRLTEVRAGAVELVDADEHYAGLRASLTA